MNSKELKKDALTKFSGKFGKLVLIQLMYSLVTLAFSLVIDFLAGKTNSSTILSFIISFVYLIVTLPLTFGVIASIMNISKDEKVSIFDFTKIGFKKFGSYWKVTLRVALKLVLPILVFTIITGVITGIIVAKCVPNLDNLFSSLTMMFLIVYSLLIILMLFILLPYTLTSFVLHENPDKTSKEILQTSAKLMKGNKFKYIKLMLSFIGWYILYAIVAYLAETYLGEFAYLLVSYLPTLLLTPYITITEISFYEDLKSKLVEKDSKSNLENNVQEVVQSEKNITTEETITNEKNSEPEKEENNEEISSEDKTNEQEKSEDNSDKKD